MSTQITRRYEPRSLKRARSSPAARMNASSYSKMTRAGSRMTLNPGTCRKNDSQIEKPSIRSGIRNTRSDTAAAHITYQRLLELGESAGEVTLVAAGLEGLARVAIAESEPAEGAMLLGRAQHLRLDYERPLAADEAERVSVWYSVPSALSMLVRYGDPVFAADLTALRRIEEMSHHRLICESPVVLVQRFDFNHFGAARDQSLVVSVPMRLLNNYFILRAHDFLGNGSNVTPIGNSEAGSRSQRQSGGSAGCDERSFAFQLAS